jgi:PE family protein
MASTAEHTDGEHQMEGHIATGFGGGGFVFTPTELDSVVADWERLHEDLLEDDRQIQALVSVRGPGDENASEGAAGRANESGTAFQAHHRQMTEAVGDYVRRLRASRQTYLATDGSALDLLRGVAR